MVHNFPKVEDEGPMEYPSQMLTEIIDSFSKMVWTIQEILVLFLCNSWQ